MRCCGEGKCNLSSLSWQQQAPPDPKGGWAQFLEEAQGLKCHKCTSTNISNSTWTLLVYLFQLVICS